MSDRFWDELGKPYVLEGETIAHAVPEVEISGTSTSAERLDFRNLKKGDLYVTTNRVAFIGQVKKVKELNRDAFDGISIFYNDMEKIKVEKGKFSILCIVRGGKKAVKARVYFKKIPSDILPMITEYINTNIQNLSDVLKTFDKPEKKEKQKADKKKSALETQISKEELKRKKMFEEAEVEEIEMVCPLCGETVYYTPGMTICPHCNKKVKFF
ncbi:MAG: hypothetical protein ACTSRW_00550 [Candidatus Helarchaeota archaeon]